MSFIIFFLVLTDFVSKIFSFFWLWDCYTLQELWYQIIGLNNFFLVNVSLLYLNKEAEVSENKDILEQWTSRNITFYLNEKGGPWSRQWGMGMYCDWHTWMDTNQSANQSQSIMDQQTGGMQLAWYQQYITPLHTLLYAFPNDQESFEVLCNRQGCQL